MSAKGEQQQKAKIETQLKILLPFASPSESDNVPFKSEIERAAVFCLAEINRETGRGLFRKKPSEKIVLLSKVYYPFWLAPFREINLLLDGLTLSTYSISWEHIPDVDSFLEDMKQRSSTHQMYVTFLSNCLNFFENSGNHEDKVIEGLVSDLEFFREFMNYSKDGIATDRAVIDGVLVSPSYDGKQIAEQLKELEDFQLKTAQELAKLNEAVKLLNAKTHEFIESLRQEIKVSDDKFAAKIEAANAILTKKKEQISKEYSGRVTEVSDSFDKELEEQHKETFRLEKTKEELSSQIERTESESRTATVNKDDAAVERWKEKKSELRKQIPNIDRSIKDQSIKIEEIESRKKDEIFKLGQESDSKISEARKGVLEVEASRDAAKKIYQDEMEKMDDLTSNIIAKIDKLAKARESIIAQFEGLGIRQEVKALSLIYMPFYLFRYQSASGSRYSFVAPSLVRTSGLNARLLAIGKKKISSLLQPRSQKIDFMLNRLLELMENNVAFSRDINEACSKVSLLGSKDGFGSISLGLGELKAEGWLSDEESKYFSQAIT